MQLSIVIVNYNVKYFLEHCLLSTIKAIKNIHAEILVIDNNSSDGSEAYLTEKFKSVHFYWLKENIGFGRANNYALQFAKGEHILFLNPDTILPEDCLEKCLAFFDKTPNCGGLGVRMINGKGVFLKESKRCLPSASSGFFKMIGLANLFPTSKYVAKYYAGHLPEKENNTVEVLAGAFMMLSKKAIEITKGFDEDFFLYAEDIDLSYRIIKAGLQNYYFGETTIIHFKGESSKKKSKAYINNFYGAMQCFVSKHYSNMSSKKNWIVFGIVVRKKIAHILLKIFPPKAESISLQKTNCLLVGNNEQLKLLTNFTNQSGYTIVKNTLQIDESILILSTQNFQAIIFCEGDIENKIIIDWVQKIPTSISVLFYESHASSIVGSNNSNENGVVIANAL